MNNGSAVVETMRQASSAAWERWRTLRAEGKGGTPEGLEAYEQARFASATYVGEVVGRAAAVRGVAP